MTTYAVTWGKDNRPKLHRPNCNDVAKYELNEQPVWLIEAETLRDAMWIAGEDQRQINDDPDDMDEDPGVDLMGCVEGL